MATEKDILAALSKVLGPDGRTPLTDSGAITGISIRDDKAYVAITIDPARARLLEPMRAAAERALLDLKIFTGAVVTLTAERTGGSSAAPQKKPQTAKLSIPGVRFIVAIASGKGGVGKSTTSVNLALALQAHGWRVGLMDADIYGPSLPRLLGASDRPRMAGDPLTPLEAYGLKLMSMGFLVEERAAVIWRGPMVVSALNKMLRETHWGALDCLVVDMPPGTGDAQLTMAQQAPLAGAIIVSTPQDLALIDARRGISMFEQVAVPILGLIENMSYFVCPRCGERTELFGHGGARAEAETVNAPFLGEVPLAQVLRETSDAGKPIVVSQPDSPYAQAYLAIAARLIEALEHKPTHIAPKITFE